MRLSKLLGRRTKDTPKDAQTPSHIFLLRGGYVKPVSTGIFTLQPLGQRICAKIEKIIREEMDAIEGQEVTMPVVLPMELWDESGRSQSVGPELLRFKDRNDKKMILGMTHEEAVVHLVRNNAESYKQLPVMIYQIQTKYRDEARPRAGLIRVREFKMKDAYSFHTSQEDLKGYYDRCHEAYVRIFKRVGMKDVISIESDTGMMGGTGAHEFMAISESGEDTLFLSPDGRYKANREVAKTALKFSKSPELPLEKVHTPALKTIEDLAAFLKISTSQTGKAVFYADDDHAPKGGASPLVFAVIRGDIEVNETKLKNHLKAPNLRFARDDEIRAVGAVPGFASPLGLDPAKVRMVFDPSARESSNLVVGANEEDWHYKNFNFDRDMKAAAAKIEVVDIATAREGDPCPVTGQPLQLKRGIEVGNIFQLGTKYSAAMGCTFLDEQGKAKPMIMGCYGIGVGRAMASVIEQSHDQYGPIWPFAIAPYAVHICALNASEPQVREAAEKLYADLQAAGVEVVYDDRNEKAGFMFADADLMGVPFRVILSPKSLADGIVEFKRRTDGKNSERVAASQILGFLKEKIAAEITASRLS